MAGKLINAEMVRKMFLAGAAKLDSQKEKINDLNVFPVPDGDTGTNMTMTIMSAAKEVEAVKEVTMQAVAKAMATGSLRGARGNSGVIFSQLCRGFAKEIEHSKEITVEIIARGARHAAETAYKAVMQPKEGTILTVAKGIAEKATEVAKETKQIDIALDKIIEHAEYVLSQTPEMLPVLKEAGVVDSGGQGLVAVLHGIRDGLTGQEGGFEVTGSKALAYQAKKLDLGKKSSDDIEFGYCTEYIIKLDKEFTEDDEMEFKKFLSEKGNSIVCVCLDDIVKIHVHTNHPGEVFEKGLTYGQLSRMKIDNMREEHEENLDTIEELSKAEEEEEAKANEVKKNLPPAKEVAFIAVTPGTGIADIFRDMGADAIIEGGQTMNPSTEDILKAVEDVNAKNVIILPNNSNIILAASQAGQLAEDKEVFVVPTKTIPQGIAAVVAFEPDASAKDNVEAMNESIAYVKSGEITYAVRDTSIDGTVVNKGDYIAINDNGLVASTTDIKDSLLSMLDNMVDTDSELITIYYGSDVEKSAAEEISSLVADKYTSLEVELQSGGQPVYYYIVSVE